MRDLYRPLYLIETPFVITDIATSEMIKYASNAFLATKVSFINEMANLCEHVGSGHTNRRQSHGIGPSHRLQIPARRSGIWRIVFSERCVGINSDRRKCRLHHGNRSGNDPVNERQKLLMVEKIETALGGLKGKTVGLLEIFVQTEYERFTRGACPDDRGALTGGRVRRTRVRSAANGRRHQAFERHNPLYRCL